ncbi:MAG: hypothetical protein Fur0037_09760 [Planctomycetota bacterium]
MIDRIRERCWRCFRPGRLCLCADLPTVPTRTSVRILQHPKERRHAFGTARLLGLMLPNAKIHVAGRGFSGGLSVRFPVPDGAVLLYPHRNAVDLRQIRERPSAIVAIDGTWSQANRL